MLEVECTCLECVLLSFCSRASSPAIRFQELVKKQEAREKKEVKILLRKKDSDESRPSVQKETGTTPSGDSTPKTLEEREEEFLREREEQYMKARARIFEEEGNGPNESTDVAPLQKVSTTVFDESPMADRAVYARADPSIYQRMWCGRRVHFCVLILSTFFAELLDVETECSIFNAVCR